MFTKKSLFRHVKQILINTPLGTLCRFFSLLLLNSARYLNKLFEFIHNKLPQSQAHIDAAKLVRSKRLNSYNSHLASLLETIAPLPKISILVPVYKTNHLYLREMLDSIQLQIYPNWELCIVDDASKDTALTSIIEAFCSKNPGKTHFRTHDVNLHISETSNTCLHLATGEYVVLLDHDDRLTPNALAEIVRVIYKENNPDILYSDERIIDSQGAPDGPVYRKPGWSPYLHLSVNYTTHLSTYKRSLLQKIGGFRAGYEGAQDHDLMLRASEQTDRPIIHIPFCLYQWRSHEVSTAGSASAKPYAAKAGEKAVTDAMIRRGKPGAAIYDAALVNYRLHFDTPKDQPLVSIIIPSKDSSKILSTCLSSIFSKTIYQNFEIIISDNGSTEEATLALYEQYKADHPNRFQVLKTDRAFNFAAQTNDGARVATGRFLLLLNNDTEVITPNWLSELLMYAQFPDVGPVGCKLLYPDHTIQHAGVYGHDRMIANHGGYLLEKTDNVYRNYFNIVHECLAVTAACLMIEKQKYFAVGGLDEFHLPNGYGDVALCLELLKQGYKTIYTPHAELVHHESPSRGRSIEYYERIYMMRKYGQELLLDPYLNPCVQRSSRLDNDPFYDDLDV